MASSSPSIKLIKASDGSGNASAATVQAIRSAGATTIQVDTVQGIPTNFYATMGTPHTFTDPVTGETITVISEASAVDFEGHVDGSDLEIDAIAPGYTDNGSAVGDIVVIRPTTPYANNVANVLEVSHNDDGTIKNEAISSADMFTDPLDPILRASETIFDHVASGCVITGDSYGSTRAASMTAGVVYINGKRYVVNAVTARLYTASKDTYVDAPIPASGNTIANADLVYTEVANNAASPALAANSIRLGIVVTGASNIASVASINQGQEFKVLPINSSIAYSVTDSLGNLICPRDPSRKLLGYRQITASLASRGNQTTEYDVTGLSVPVIVPEGRKIAIKGFIQYQTTGGIGTIVCAVRIKEGATQIQASNIVPAAANLDNSGFVEAGSVTTTAGLHTYKIVVIQSAVGPNHQVDAYANAPAFIKVELE